jgi:predicted secreted protein
MQHYDREAKLIEARPGESFDVRLPSLPAAGYTWSVRVQQEDIVRLAGQSIEPGQAVGAAALDAFVFEAVHEGRTVLEFRYGRPWEASPEETRQIPVNVEAAAKPHQGRH